MVLWNAFQENRDYSLEEVIETALGVKLLVERGIDRELLLEMNIKEEIDKRLDDYKFFDEYDGKKENYIGNELKKINTMLNIMVGKENRKLIYLKRTDRIFTSRNCIFFTFILETYHGRDSKMFRKGKYHKVKDDFFDYLYKGMKDLVCNPNVRLTIDIVNQKWNTVFGKSYRRFLFTYSVFHTCMKSIILRVLKMDERDVLFQQIQSKLELYLYEIGGLDPSLFDLLIFRNDFGDGYFDEIDE